MANYDSVAAIFNHPNVLQKLFVDVISTQNVLTWWLHGKPINLGPNGGTKITAKKFIREQDGGSRFEVPLMLDTNTNLKTYEKSESFDLTASNVGDRAFYNIQSMGGPIPIYGYDIDVCGSNKTNLFNLTKTFLEQASLSVLNLVQTNLLRAQGTEGANDWTSLLTLCPTDPTADSIGGISAATYTNWRNDYKNRSGDSIATYLRPELTASIIRSTFGNRSPKLIIMTPSLYGDLHGQLVSNQRYVPDVELAKAGFKGMEYDGASVIFDTNMTAGSILGLNPEALEYGVLKNANMKVEDFVRVPDGDVVVAFIKHRGNTIMKDRRTNFRVFTFTTA